MYTYDKYRQDVTLVGVFQFSIPFERRRLREFTSLFLFFRYKNVKKLGSWTGRHSNNAIYFHT
ncbi:MAG: hypothetical protein CV087_08815, partial [Candidatus Brocadia sp. WS118]